MIHRKLSFSSEGAASQAAQFWYETAREALLELDQLHLVDAAVTRWNITEEEAIKRLKELELIL